MTDPATVSTRESGNGVGKVKKARKQRENISRYPASINFGVTVAMAQSLIRMCPHNGPFNQSTYGRLLIHRGLLTDDPQYRREMGGET
jgi:hypothetical protein